MRKKMLMRIIKWYFCNNKMNIDYIIVKCIIKLVIV